MHVGDTWNYISITSTDTQRISIKIIKKAKLLNKEYYIFDRWIDNSFWFNKGFIRLRYDSKKDQIVQLLLTERREIVDMIL
ncbi:hypothetical protein DRQ09_03015 [candidate division KSB1 bacterium]|nr:MAG: hypothetical protein DRQ09_03015 [candidate division KSB1 bacterium]